MTWLWQALRNRVVQIGALIIFVLAKLKIISHRSRRRGRADAEREALEDKHERVERGRDAAAKEQQDSADDDAAGLVDRLRRRDW